MCKDMNDLVKKMSIKEMVRLMHGVWGLHGLLPFTYRLNYYQTRGITRFGIPPLRFTDGPKGINLNHSTCFPVAIARGATFDPVLEEKVGVAMGIEARHQGANAVGSACINLIRHPGWGRAQESFGADPYHVGVMASAHIRGLAKNVMPVVKHFACNNIENTRFKVSVTIDERTLREIYLPHFKAAIDAGAAAIMSAYNKLNGIYCGENRYLLTEILRDEWKFKGFVMSDFFLGCHNTVESIKAGLDIEMPVGWYYRYWRIRRYLQKGIINRHDIERCVSRIIETMEKYGLCEPFKPEPKKHVACKKHTDLALEVALKSIVLLKNDAALLPLHTENIKTIAIIGKHAKKLVLGDIASSAVKPPFRISLLDAVKERVGNCCSVLYTSNYTKAKKIAARADVVIMLFSLTWKDEGENIPFGGGDRTRLELPSKYVKLIKEISAINKRSIVVVQAGSAVCMDEWIDNVPGVIMAWYPGMQGGRATTKVLFGDYNPAGRLPISIPKHTSDLPFFDTKSLHVMYDYYHDYFFFDTYNIEPRFCFGYGLSYTNFKYISITLNKNIISENDELKIHIALTNDGPMDGEEVVQLYIDYRNSKLDPKHRRKLKGFKRIFIRKGEKAKVQFTIRAKDLSYYDPGDATWRIEKIKYIVCAGSSLFDVPLQAEFEIR